MYTPTYLPVHRFSYSRIAFHILRRISNNGPFLPTHKSISDLHQTISSQHSTAKSATQTNTKGKRAMLTIPLNTRELAAPFQSISCCDGSHFDTNARLSAAGIQSGAKRCMFPAKGIVEDQQSRCFALVHMNSRNEASSSYVMRPPS